MHNNCQCWELENKPPKAEAAAVARRPTWLPHRGQQEVVWQELQLCWLKVLPKTVHFQAALVIDVHILFLCGCKKKLVVQERDCTGGLLDLWEWGQRGVQCTQAGQKQVKRVKCGMVTATAQLAASRVCLSSYGAAQLQP